MLNPTERAFAQALIKQLQDELNRAHGKEMHTTPTQVLYAARHTIETLLTDITVLETERALAEGRTPERLETPTQAVARKLEEGLGVRRD